MNKILLDQLEESQALNNLLIDVCHSQRKTIQRLNLAIVILVLFVIMVLFLGICVHAK